VTSHWLGHYCHQINDVNFTPGMHRFTVLAADLDIYHPGTTVCNSLLESLNISAQSHWNWCVFWDTVYVRSEWLVWRQSWEGKTVCDEDDSWV